MEGTLGKFNEDSGAVFTIGSGGMLSFVFRLLERLLARFSTPSLTEGLASFAGASDGVVMALCSSLAELDAFEDECFRWCIRAEGPFEGPVINAWEDLLSAEHDKQVQVLLRARPLEYRNSMVRHSLARKKLSNPCCVRLDVLGDKVE